MTEMVITSSVLICMVLLLRALVRGRVSRGVQYALWLVVLLRLALPFPLLDSPVSVMNLADMGTGPAAYEEMQPVGPGQVAEGTATLSAGDGAMLQPAGDNAGAGADALLQGLPADPSWVELAVTVWLCVAVAFGLWFLLSNLLFYARLRKNRVLWIPETPLPVQGCRLPIYVAQHIPSPCLFGLLRPAIYLTPEALKDAGLLHCAIAHEFAHYRQGDHIWSLLRSLCLACYWFNPLVWLAAFCSRRDGELACDEKTVRLLGGERSTEYGQALIRMVSAKATPSQLLCTATTMVSGKREIRERLNMIVKNPRNRAGVLLVAVLALALAAGCTFTGAKDGEPEAPDSPAPTVPAEELPVSLEELPTEVYGTYEIDHINETVWLLAQQPDHDLYVYGLNANTTMKGVLVRWGESTYYGKGLYYMTPRQILPQVDCADYDGDGQPEVALSLYIASGTGVGISNLHIIEKSADGTLSAHLYESEEYIALLNEALSWDFDRSKDQVTVHIGDSSSAYSLHPEFVDTFERPMVTGDIATFEIQGMQIEGYFGLAMIYENGPYGMYGGDITANIRWDGSAFSMEDLTARSDAW